MAAVKILSISYLLKNRRPICGTSSLNTCHSSPSPQQQFTHQPKPPTRNTTTTTTSDTKTLKPLSEPSMIIGTISLPSLVDPSSSAHTCFSFSDTSGSVCCDILDIDLRMIGRQIHVIAWNFIPFKQCGGVLEIIKWIFPEVSTLLVDSFPLVSHDVGKDSEMGQVSVCGVLNSVSPFSFVSCSTNSERNGNNVGGFIVEVLSCDCRVCYCVKNLGDIMQDCKKHRFNQTNFVYFSGDSSSWHPAFLKFTGKLILLSGLRRRVVHVGEEEPRLMLVSNKATCLRYSKLGNECVIRGKYNSGKLEGKGELGHYVGFVRGIYMQGMVVELDDEVWLLLTDKLLVLPHSVRVGAFICVRNVHIVNPRFGWAKMLILGTCYKTNISTVLFSPLETGCHMPSQSQSLLRKFIEALVFPARLWVLLVVRCLRKKLCGAFSEKEILGTKHKEGLVEIYARSMLPSSVLRLQHSMLMEFCKHNSCGCGLNISYGSLRLAVPFYNLVNNCERIWTKSVLQMKSGIEILEDCSQVNHPFQEKRLLDQPIRRIVPSKEIGVSLLGSLKISSATGRLQFTDATGSIDAVVPDLPSDWDMNAIYEVIDYSLVIEGRPEIKSQTWILDDDLFSCGSMFCSVTLGRQTELTIFVQFAWSNVNCRNFPSQDCQSSEKISPKLDHGTYHFLHLAHKFPVQKQNHDDMLISGKGLSFAEAMVLPCDLIISASDDAALPGSMSQDELKKSYESGFSFKRCKTNHASSCLEQVGLSSNFSQYGSRSYGHSDSLLSLSHKTRTVDNFKEASPAQITCTVDVRSIDGQSMTVSGVLSFPRGDLVCDIHQFTNLRTLLLEFDSGNFFKYKSLRIGAYYIMKHDVDKCFCDSNSISSTSKVVFNLETCLWSLSFKFHGIFSGSGLCHDEASDSFCISENTCSCYLQNDLLLHPCGAADHMGFYHVSLNVTSDATSLPGLDLQALKEAILRPSVRLRNLCSIGQPVGCRNAVASFSQSQGTYSGNNLPQGNLISLVGTVVSLNSGCCSVEGVSSNGAAADATLRFIPERKCLICLHVLTDGHMVQIDGYLSKHDYPVGLGPGADVTFHRILAFGGQEHFMLTSVSIITVNSVREVPSFSVCSFHAGPEETVESCLISDLIQYDACKPRRFCCRVVAVHIVMLERNRNLDKLLSVHSRKPIVNIPLAGFVLDDGSSKCCCWANGERAATLLRLHERMTQVGLKSWWRSDGSGIGKGCSTPIVYLNKILKRHGRVSVKNYGTLYEALSQDLQLSVGSDYILDSEDEYLIKFIILNACSSTSWCVIGNVMDYCAINELEKYLLDEQMNMHALRNVWAREVCQVNTLVEARTLYQDL